jgi:hypothetical protein
MSVFSEGFGCFIGDGEDPEVFTAELALLEVPEMFTGSIATFARRTTASTGTTKQYGLGLEEGDEMALVAEKDFDDAAQELLRTAYAAKLPINIKFSFSDGTTTETNTAPFLITSQPVAPTDPNGDGESVKQTWNIKRNADWVPA